MIPFTKTKKTSAWSSDIRRVPRPEGLSLARRTSRGSSSKTEPTVSLLAYEPPSHIIDSPITFSSSGPVIRFEKTHHNVREPKRRGDVTFLEIPVKREGDLTRISIVRIHTKDGSAKSGSDYNGLSQGRPYHRWNPAVSFF